MMSSVEFWREKAATRRDAARWKSRTWLDLFFFLGKAS